MALPAWAADSPSELARIDPVAALTLADEELATAKTPADRAVALAERALALGQLDRNDEALAELARAKSLLAAGDMAERGEVVIAEARIRANRQDYAGAEALAREARVLWTSVFGPESAEVAAVETVLGTVINSQSRFDEGLPFTRHAWEVLNRLRPPGDTERLAAGMNYAIGLGAARAAREAQTLFLELSAEVELLPAGHSYRAKLPKLLGAEFVRQGRLNEGIPFLRRAVNEGENARGLVEGERADALASLGYGLLYQDRPEDALPFFERAFEQFGVSGTIQSQIGAYIGAGTAAERSGNRALGLAYREKGQALIAGLTQQSELMNALSGFKLAQSYVHAGRLPEAEAKASQAAEVLGRLRPARHFQATNSKISLGWITALRGQTAAGLALVRQQFRLAVDTNEALEVSRNQVVGVLDNIEAYSQTLQTAALAGDHEFAFEVMQVMVETDASRAAVAVTEREQAKSSVLGLLLRRRQDAASAAADADAALTRSINAADGGASVRAGLEGVLADKRQTLAGIDAELDSRFPDFRTVLRPKRIALAAARARLARDEALLVIEESDLGLYTMAITRSGSAIGHNALRRPDVRALVRRIRASIDGGAQEFDRAAAHALYQAIFTPPVRALIGKGMRLRLASGDILSSIPLNLLVVDPGTGLGDARYLIEDHALSVVPSIASMRQDGRGGGSATRPGRRFVAVGAPALSGDQALVAGPDYYAAGVSRAVRIGQLQALPGASREIAEVARVLHPRGQSVLLTGRAATEPAVRGLDLRDVGVLLFATHGLVAGAFDAQSEPALVLTPPTSETPENDGLLSASEAAQLDTDADWVILSACDTAAGSQPTAAGYTGLARAFLFAGAKRVVASHWPVRDDIAARLSLGLVRGIGTSKSPEEALRASILAVLRDRKLTGARDPVLWAPFMVVAR